LILLREFPAAIREPPACKELTEGAVVLMALAATTATIIWLPRPIWATMLPGVLLLPMSLWLTARCRPIFASAGVSQQIYDATQIGSMQHRSQPDKGQWWATS
jgi:hypothetical protein